MGRLERAWRQVRWSLAQRGVGGTLRVVRERATGRRGPEAVVVHPFDVEFGVDTSGVIGGGALAGGGVNDRYSTAYHGVPPSRMRDVLRRWLETPGTGAVEEYAMVDVGCGKGRAMMLASEKGFRAVVGVELNAGLVQVAEKNLLRWRELGRMRSAARCVHGDVTEVELPAGPLLVYLYNPFQAPVLRALLKRLETRAGMVDVLYVVPAEEEAFGEFPRFDCLWSEKMVTAEEDMAVDPMVSIEDRCSLWRLKR